MPRDLYYGGDLGVHKYLDEERLAELVRIAYGLNDDEEHTEDEGDSEEEDEVEETEELVGESQMAE